MIQQKAPPFTLPDQNNTLVSLKDYKGKWVVVYFYPKDNTPGCTAEAIGFSKKKDAYTSLNCEIVGISPDTPESHKNFCKKKNLSITLLSDTKRTTLKDYKVWQLKKFMGREFQGVVRSTFLINPEGKIVQGWENVRVLGHVEDVLETLENMQ